MSKIQKPTISIVIPAYNEEKYIRECLESIAAQTIQPDEVIVVDNNSTDDTVAIARKYSFVTIISEQQQGVSYAQAAGFHAAKSEIIARIDGDTRLTDTWVEQIVMYFDDARISAITGRGIAYDQAAGTMLGYVQVLVYQYIQRLIARGFVLWGSNMAIRRAVWLNIASQCHNNARIDDDIDLSLVLLKNKYRIIYNSKLVVYVSVRRGDIGLVAAIKYLSSWPHDYWVNKRYIGSFFITLLTALTFILMMPAMFFASIRKHQQIDRH